ncbi:nuclear transport factor 2 family protein [Granulicella sp. S190]|uniref:nuclear transport factor 2 family protein n=1 Tax=Granulicella sp. S190 TaxID=1747226 RepID=UPI0020B1344D|nr:nuclear transport factor 2 family protein [Granulicella sp. S190]
MGSAVILAAVIMGWPAPSAFAGHMQPLHEKKHDAKRQVEALEEQWRQAQLAGDVATMDKLLSDDYIGITMTGQVSTKIQQLDRMRTHKFVLSKLDLGEMQVKLIGSIAIVTSRAEVEGTNEGVAFQGTYRYTRVYQRLPSGVWKITSFEATRVPGPREPGNRDTVAPKAASSVPPLGPS